VVGHQERWTDEFAGVHWKPEPMRGWPTP
jgi:hypothetical protein